MVRRPTQTSFILQFVICFRKYRRKMMFWADCYVLPCECALEPDGEAMASVCRMPRGRTISPRRASREPPPKECIHVGLRLPLAVTADAGYPGRSSQVARKRRHLIDLARVEGHPAVIWITLVYFPAQNSIR